MFFHGSISTAVILHLFLGQSLFCDAVCGDIRRYAGDDHR